ncbi:MAG: SDR family NAD(P)-dependent oxidoreductase [Acidimicrobiia bacterium]
MSPPVAIVTGGASGIGLASCERLAAEGFQLAVFDVSAEGAKAAAGPDGLGLAVDVADAAAVEGAVATVVRSFGRIDVLFSNAGITGSADATVCHETTIEEFERVLGVNARAPFFCSRAALPTMLAQGSGQIIITASVAGLVAFPGRCAYVVSKGAALMLAKSIAADYGAKGIRANAICPGAVQTPMIQWRLDDPELSDRFMAAIPMRRVAQPEEIADAVVLLATGRLGYMNGSAWVIDGGWTSI